MAVQFHELFPGEPPLVFFRMRDASGYFLTDSSTLSDVLEDRASVSCFRCDQELEGRGPKPTCSITNLLKYSATFALQEALEGSGEAMNSLVALVFLDDCATILKKIMDNFNDLAFVQLFIRQGGLFALLRRVSRAASTQNITLQLALEILEKLIHGPLGKQMEEIFQEMDPFVILCHHGMSDVVPELSSRVIGHELKVLATPRGKGKKGKGRAEEEEAQGSAIMQRLSQRPDETIASPEFFVSLFSAPQSFEQLWPVFQSAKKRERIELLARHWAVSLPPRTKEWDPISALPDVEEAFYEALLRRPKVLMHCLESCFARSALRALKDIINDPESTGCVDYLDSLPVKLITCLLLTLVSKVSDLMLPTMEILGLFCIKDEYREFLLRETSFFDFLCATLMENVVKPASEQEKGKKDAGTRNATAREVAKCLVHLSADAGVKSACKQNLTINDALIKTKDPLVRHYLNLL